MYSSEKLIMIIDDDDSTRLLLSRVLTSAGYLFKSCAGVKEALESLKETAPHLIILDLNMPDFDGFAFLKFRKINKTLTQIPVFVLSGSKDKQLIQKALELGANQFLEKPFETRSILQKIKYIFSSKENFFYRLKNDECDTLDAQISGNIIAQHPGSIKVESQVRFAYGKSVILRNNSLLKNECESLVFKVNNKMMNSYEGLFQTELCPTGLTPEEKTVYEKWQKEMSK
jgi:two-component system chemotaxis response regulator CheY